MDEEEKGNFFGFCEEGRDRRDCTATGKYESVENIYSPPTMEEWGRGLLQRNPSSASWTLANSLPLDDG